MAAQPNPYKAVCAWCGKVVRDGKEPITHTICKDCEKKVDDGTYEPPKKQK